MFFLYEFVSFALVLAKGYSDSSGWIEGVAFEIAIGEGIGFFGEFELFL